MLELINISNTLHMYSNNFSPFGYNLSHRYPALGNQSKLCIKLSIFQSADQANINNAVP